MLRIVLVPVISLCMISDYVLGHSRPTSDKHSDMTLRSDLANKSDAPDTRLFKGGPSSYERDITNNVEEQSSDENGEADPAAEALGSKKALWAYMILCFSVRKYTILLD